MHRMLYVALLATLLPTACYVVPARGPDYAVAPPLPLVVELGVEPYYYQGGFYYFYHDRGWSYSDSRAGPWRDLPRDRYPRELRFRGDRGRGHGDRD